jgi:hypothetical protein
LQGISQNTFNPTFIWERDSSFISRRFAEKVVTNIYDLNTCKSINSEYQEEIDTLKKIQHNQDTVIFNKNKYISTMYKYRAYQDSLILVKQEEINLRNKEIFKNKIIHAITNTSWGIVVIGIIAGIFIIKK